MYEIIATKQFLKGYKRSIARKLDILLLDKLIVELSETGTVPQNHKPHILTGNLKGLHECHIKPDWLLIWETSKSTKTITLLATGSHSDLFE